MTVLSEVRGDARELLEDADLHAFSTIPSKVSPPFVCVAPGSPYVSYESDAGLSFGEALLRLRLTLVVGRGDNDAEADALDELILQVLDLDWDSIGLQVEEVGEPGPAPVNGQIYLGTNVHLSRPMSL